MGGGGRWKKEHLCVCKDRGGSRLEQLGLEIEMCELLYIYIYRYIYYIYVCIVYICVHVYSICTYISEKAWRWRCMNCILIFLLQVHNTRFQQFLFMMY
jgi:hypothetical protein